MEDRGRCDGNAVFEISDSVSALVDDDSIPDNREGGAWSIRLVPRGKELIDLRLDRSLLGRPVRLGLLIERGNSRGRSLRPPGSRQWKNARGRPERRQ